MDLKDIPTGCFIAQEEYERYETNVFVVGSRYSVTWTQLMPGVDKGGGNQYRGKNRIFGQGGRPMPVCSISQRI